MSNKIADELIGNVIDIVFGLGNALAILIKASPILIIGWILFIAPNC